MARYNKKGVTPKGVMQKNRKTRNAAGGVSYERDIRNEIAIIILNAVLSGKDDYYESHADRSERIENLFAEAFSGKYAEFAAKAIVYSRTKANLRTLPAFLSVIMVENKVPNSEYVRRAIFKAIQRPDDMKEMVALWNSRHTIDVGKSQMVPNAMRRAMRDVLESGRFDAFQLRRYMGNSGITLKDIIRLTHPNPSKLSDRDLFKKALNDELPAIGTMETLLSGGAGAKESMVSLLGAKKLGYMAAIKNIRNFMSDNPSNEELDMWVNLVTNRKALEKSRMLPFRFFQAYQEIAMLSMDELVKRKVLNALDTAFKYSAIGADIAKVGERVALILDESGSMAGSNFNMNMSHIGALMSTAMIAKLGADNVVYYTFATGCANRSNDVSMMAVSPLQYTYNFRAKGGGTDIGAPLKELIKTKTKVDKIIIFTDMQMYDCNNYGYGSSITEGEFRSYFSRYRTQVNPDAKLLFWNLNAYKGGTPIEIKDGIMEIGGFSDKMYEVAGKLFDNPNYLIEDIDKIKLW
jgi:60 kDa SS-A/Ro ribonucleoprotein